MKRILSASALLAVVLALGCEEAPPAGMTETTILALEGSDGQRVELGIPLDLTPVETALSALKPTKSAGGLFNVEIMAGQQFGASVGGAMGLFSIASPVPGGFGASAPITGAFSATSGCDMTGAICQFGMVACQYLPQLVTKFAEDKEGALAGFNQATCSQSLCGGGELIDLSGVPPAFACAATGVLNCVAGQLPSLVNVLMTIDPNGENDAAAEALNVVGSELAVCLAGYADALGALLDVQDVEAQNETNPWR